MESALPPAPPNASGSVEMHAQKQPKSYDKYNPCFPAGFISKDGMMGTANFTDCYSRAHQLLHTTAPCESGSCSINGTYQPPLRGAYYALDNYVDAISFLELPEDVTLDAVEAATAELCALNDTAFRDKYGDKPKDECFTACYTIAMLRDGFHFAPNRSSVLFEETVAGSPVSWPYGSMVLEAADYSSPSTVFDLVNQHPQELAIGLVALGGALVLAGVAAFIWMVMLLRRRRSYHTLF
eukprot:TRINITY_DN1161_c0_g1_i2.p2 TRINITY_DN1161_c0_g1~~TRINITY_DN1161_c0_g1_i2.p2  ORF type:complete len:239 (+),score=76.13 TRINITY_DN1161_c0_g1_i2:1469-2185(+)